VRVAILLPVHILSKSENFLSQGNLEGNNLRNLSFPWFKYSLALICIERTFEVMVVFVKFCLFLYRREESHGTAISDEATILSSHTLILSLPFSLFPIQTLYATFPQDSALAPLI